MNQLLLMKQTLHPKLPIYYCISGLCFLCLNVHTKSESTLICLLLLHDIWKFVPVGNKLQDLNEKLSQTFPPDLALQLEFVTGKKK